jgi:hypothetical protein
MKSKTALAALASAGADWRSDAKTDRAEKTMTEWKLALADAGTPALLMSDELPQIVLMPMRV